MGVHLPQLLNLVPAHRSYLVGGLTGTPGAPRWRKG